MNQPSSPELLETLRASCAEHGLKLTHQRIAVYEALCATADHPSADTIYRSVSRTFPSISFDTVNRTLITFAKIGLLKVVEGRGDPKRFDPDTHPHHHFRCTACATIVDFASAAYDRLKVPPEISRRFHVTDKKVLLEGVCPACSKKSQH